MEGRNGYGGYDGIGLNSDCDNTDTMSSKETSASKLMKKFVRQVVAEPEDLTSHLEKKKESKNADHKMVPKVERVNLSGHV